MFVKNKKTKENTEIKNKKILTSKVGSSKKHLACVKECLIEERISEVRSLSLRPTNKITKTPLGVKISRNFFNSLIC